MTPAQQLLRDADERMKKSVSAVTRQLGEVRGGRANPALIEHLTVSYFGTPTPLKQLAAVTAPEPRLLLVQPWDPSLVPEIEKAILKSELGITPASDKKLLRLPVPPLTTEQLDQGNAKHAQDHADCTKEETLEMLRTGGAAAATAVRGLTDEQLDKTSTVISGAPDMSVEQVIENVLIGSAAGHGASIKKTL